MISRSCLTCVIRTSRERECIPPHHSPNATPPRPCPVPAIYISSPAPPATTQQQHLLFQFVGEPHRLVPSLHSLLSPYHVLSVKILTDPATDYSRRVGFARFRGGKGCNGRDQGGPCRCRWADLKGGGAQVLNPTRVSTSRPTREPNSSRHHTLPTPPTDAQTITQGQERH
ncbi:hypothetical protein DFS34DRAFT_277342 [Phlyctochytrium arcticum]|nr:hypothetical protein DFS34DRAFT_277342 [Phlyctochytrium arcticum]